MFDSLLQHYCQDYKDCRKFTIYLTIYTAIPAQSNFPRNIVKRYINSMRFLLLYFPVCIIIPCSCALSREYLIARKTRDCPRSTRRREKERKRERHRDMYTRISATSSLIRFCGARYSRSRSIADVVRAFTLIINLLLFGSRVL